MRGMIVDVETLKLAAEVQGGWDNVAGFGFGTAVAYVIQEDRYAFFGPEDHSMMRDAIQFAEANNWKIIGFNSVKFDMRVIMGNQWMRKPRVHIDLLERIIKSKFDVKSIWEATKEYGKWKVFDGTINLNAIASNTLGITKTGDGKDAPGLINQGLWSAVFAYNLADVRITKQLYEFGLKYGFVIDGNSRKIRVNFT